MAEVRCSVEHQSTAHLARSENRALAERASRQRSPPTSEWKATRAASEACVASCLEHRPKAAGAAVASIFIYQARRATCRSRTPPSRKQAPDCCARRLHTSHATAMSGASGTHSTSISSTLYIFCVYLLPTMSWHWSAAHPPPRPRPSSAMVPLSLEAAVLRTAGSQFWLSPKGRKSSAQLGAPKFDKFVEFVASGYGVREPHQGSWPRSGSSLPPFRLGRDTESRCARNPDGARTSTA